MLKRRPKFKAAPAVPRAIVSHNYANVVTRWILRLLIKCKGSQRLIGPAGFTDDAVLRFIGLGQYASGEDWDEPSDSLSPSQCLTILRSRWRCLDDRALVYRGTLFRNLKVLGKRLELNNAERLLIAFALLKEQYEELSTVWEWTMEGRNRLSGRDVLAATLGLTPAEVGAACAGEARLTASGLLQCLDGHSSVPCFELLDGLGQNLLGENFRSDTLLGQYFSVQPGKRLKYADFAHLGADLADLKLYLKQVAKQRKCGSNILLWGPPGVGKSELARTLSAECGLILHEVTCVNTEGEAIPPYRRRRIYRLCQHLLKASPEAVVLFDEMEDFFTQGFDESLFGGQDLRLGKAWFNRMLEQSPVPVIWISNAIDMIDPAYLRRFDYVLELGAPPPDTRKRMLAEACSDIPVSDTWLERIAGYSHVTPAQIGQAAEVARLIGHDRTSDTERVMETSIRRHLKLQGRHVESNFRPVDGLIDYDLGFLNPDVDPHGLVEGLARSGVGSCLLYGPPGTGKSAFAHYLSRSLKRPLLKKSASDLLDPWVGGTEQRLAAMFEEAGNQGAVLFLDEADSFLRARGQALHSWEITMVNELLQQMESFEGIFVCATNFLQVTDDAALRRFDHKIRLDYLKPLQRDALLQAVAARLGLGCPTEIPPDTRQRLARLHNLASGDFATLVRQHVRGGWQPDSLDELMAALERESRIKPDGVSRPIGFVG